MELRQSIKFAKKLEMIVIFVLQYLMTNERLPQSVYRMAKEIYSGMHQATQIVWYIIYNKIGKLSRNKVQLDTSY
jgi:hypothetical protein